VIEGSFGGEQKESYEKNRKCWKAGQREGKTAPVGRGPSMEYGTAAEGREQGKEKKDQEPRRKLVERKK
jgi:hypothetical protein